MKIGQLSPPGSDDTIKKISWWITVPVIVVIALVLLWIWPESTPVESRTQSAYDGAIKLECGEEYGFDIKRPMKQVTFVVPPGDCSTPWIGLPSFWQMPTRVSTAMVFEVRYREGSSISKETVALEVNPIDEPNISRKPAFIRFRNPNAEPATVTLYFYY